MAQYLKGLPQDKADIVDFGNYVFSQAHRPHDFKTLLPKGYADDVDISDCHYLAKQEGKIRAMVACLPMKQELFGQTLTYGLVGTVSVHPYARGEGHMKQLMRMMIDDQRAQGVDLLALGGQRQRYNHFGFEKAGVMLNYDLSVASVRHSGRDLDASGIDFAEITGEQDPLLEKAHALYQQQPITGARSRENYLHIMHSWEGHVYAVLNHGEFAGTLYTAGSDSVLGEVLLYDEVLLPVVLKAWMEQKKPPHMVISVAPHEKQRIGLLSPMAEACSVGNCEMIHVLNWPRVLSALLHFKAQYQALTPGQALIKIEGETLRIAVEENGAISVASAEGTPDCELSHLAAERAFFSLENLCIPAIPCLKNWAPLPFVLNRADNF